MNNSDPVSIAIEKIIEIRESSLPNAEKIKNCNVILEKLTNITPQQAVKVMRELPKSSNPFATLWLAKIITGSNDDGRGADTYFHPLNTR